MPDPSPTSWRLGSPQGLRAVRASVDRFRGPIPDCVLDELAQDAVAKTLGRCVRSPVAYACATARRGALDWLRRERRVVPLTSEPVDEVRSLEGLDVARAVAWLDRAPASYRELISRLYLVEEALEDLIAAEVGGPRDQVGEPRWSRGRDAIYKRRTRALGWFRHRMAA